MQEDPDKQHYSNTKQIRHYSLLTAFVLLLLISCSRLQSGCGGAENMAPEVLAAKFSDALCDKMAQCMQAHLEQMPAEMRELARAQIPSPEKCRQMGRDLGGKGKGEQSWRELTRKEKSAAVRCMRALPEASCQAIQTQAVPECAEWRTIMESKQR